MPLDDNRIAYLEEDRTVCELKRQRVQSLRPLGLVHGKLMWGPYKYRYYFGVSYYEYSILGPKTLF